MPVLNWIGKDKVVNHDKELPFRVLKPVKDQSIGEASENLLIQGDNLEALKALMPFYYGKVKCVYIDPPYNTGNEKWVYNDKVNSPQIKAWLKKVVGPEGEDLCRHDKWLSMMYPRLKLLKDLLSEDGTIFVSIDDNELHNLRLIMNEIFGEQNFVNIFTWKKNSSGKTVNREFPVNTEYLLMYSKNREFVNFNIVYKPLAKSTKKTYSKNDHDGRGQYASVSVQKTGSPGPLTTYDYVDNNGKIWPCPKKGYRMIQKKLKALENDDRLILTGSVLREKSYWNERNNEGQIADTLWDDIDEGNIGTKELHDIFNDAVFDHPKPISLIKRAIKIGSGNNGLVLDSFAGSGTTGQAVLELNKEDGGSRKFILVELEKDIAKNVTAKRLTKVIEGYEGAKFPEGTGQGFEYLDLNGELYDYSGYVNPDAKYEDMAAYIYFTETKNYLDISSIENPHIGSQGNIHYFLFFDGKGNNVLDEEILKKTDKYKGDKIIYADKCLLDEEELTKKGIIFKQIPYELKKF